MLPRQKRLASTPSTWSGCVPTLERANRRCTVSSCIIVPNWSRGCASLRRGAVDPAALLAAGGPCGFGARRHAASSAISRMPAPAMASIGCRTTPASAVSIRRSAANHGSDPDAVGADAPAGWLGNVNQLIPRPLYHPATLGEMRCETPELFFGKPHDRVSGAATGPSSEVPAPCACARPARAWAGTCCQVLSPQTVAGSESLGQLGLPWSSSFQAACPCSLGDQRVTRFRPVRFEAYNASSVARNRASQSLPAVG